MKINSPLSRKYWIKGKIPKRATLDNFGKGKRNNNTVAILVLTIKK